MSGRIFSARSNEPRHGRDERLAERRRHTRHRGLVAFGVALLILAGALVYGLWRAPVRISTIVIYGGDASLAKVAQGAMQGAYLGIIPRDSFFFYSENDVRSAILAADANIAAVSLFRTSLTSLSLKVSGRVPVARWCGATYFPQTDATSSPTRSDLATRSDLVGLDCYLFDAHGVLYANATSTDSTPVNPFEVYIALASTTNPLTTLLPQANKLPSAFSFARQLASLGSPVIALAISDSEVNDYLASGTRVTYLLGQEQAAYAALVSARANLDLASGALEYVDLRFMGKVYLKKRQDVISR